MPSQRLFLGAVFCFSAVCGWLPMVHGPGYEHALLMGIALPSFMAALASMQARSPVRAALRGLSLPQLWASTLGIVLLGSVVSWVHFRACSPLQDLAYEVMTVGVGLLASTLVAFHTARILTSRWALGVATAAPLVSVGVSLAVFFLTPTVHAFDVFAGYFAGPLYDTVLRTDGPFANHRLAAFSWCALSALLGTSVCASCKKAASVVALASLALIFASGPRLGTWVSSRELAAQLPQFAENEECIVHAFATISPGLVERVARDGREQRREVEARLAAHFPGKIRIFVFRDGEEKGRLIGAADTLVAKPWRGEVYVQGTSYPHPVLGHEIAHVVAGAFGRGPMRIAGAAGGLVANPGLIEGVAVFASPHEEALTEKMWAAIMLEKGLLPSLEELFGLRFLTGNANRSYTAAGAFVMFVSEVYGDLAVRRWYGGEDLPEVARTSWPLLETAFHGWLARETFSDAARGVAQSRFGAPGLGARTCAHVVDASLAGADRAWREHRPMEARECIDVARRFEPENAGLQLLEALAAGTQNAESAYLRVAANERNSAVVRDEAIVRAGDLAWRAGRGDAARARYADALARAVDESRVRLLEVKRAFSGDPSTPVEVRSLLTQVAFAGEAALDPFLLGAALERWISPVETATHRAFRAQQFFLRDDCERGVEHAFRADAPELPPALFRALARGRLVCACLRGDVPAVDGVVASLRGRSAELPAGIRESLLRLAHRCVSPASPER